MQFVGNKVTHLVASTNFSFTIRKSDNTLYPVANTYILQVTNDNTGASIAITSIDLNDFHYFLNTISITEKTTTS